MRRLLLRVRERMWYLIITALFWLAALILEPTAFAGMAGVLFALLIVCSFIAVLLLGNCAWKNFLVIALLVGIFMAVAKPFAWRQDEEYHFLRAFDLTNGRFLPADAGGYVPAGYEMYTARESWTLASICEKPELWFSPVEDRTFVPRIRSASYLPLAYIPSALGMGLARLLRLPLYGVVLLGRLFNYLFYTGVCALAIARTKRLRSLIFLVAASTGAFAIAGSVSIDLPLVCCSLLFVAICFHYCFDDTDERIRISDMALLALSAAMIVSIKYFGYVLIPPFILFISQKRYANKTKAVWIVAGAVLLIAAIQIFALLRYRGSLDATGRENVGVAAQIAYILENPIRFVALMTRDILGGLYERLLGQSMPDLEAFAVIGTFGAMLPVIGALLAQDKPQLMERNKWQFAVYCLLAALVMQALSCIALYLSWTPVGEAKILGMQARYTLPFLIFVMLAASFPRVRNEIKNWTRLIGYLSLLCAVNSVAGHFFNTL